MQNGSFVIVAFFCCCCCCCATAIVSAVTLPVCPSVVVSRTLAQPVFSVFSL